MEIADSSRLSFRLMDASDGDRLFELDQDPEVMRFINGGEVSSAESIAQIMLPRMLSYRNSAKGWGLWQVTEKSTAAYLGWILVRPMGFFSDAPELHNLELGWRFKRSSWGRGIATEAARHIAQAVARQPGVTQITAIAMPDNLGSIAVMKKLGMQYQKTAIHRDPLGDEEVVYYTRALTA